MNPSKQLQEYWEQRLREALPKSKSVKTVSRKQVFKKQRQKYS